MRSQAILTGTIHLKNLLIKPVVSIMMVPCLMLIRTLLLDQILIMKKLIRKKKVFYNLRKSTNFLKESYTELKNGKEFSKVTERLNRLSERTSFKKLIITISLFLQIPRNMSTKTQRFSKVSIT